MVEGPYSNEIKRQRSIQEHRGNACDQDEHTRHSHPLDDLVCWVKRRLRRSRPSERSGAYVLRDELLAELHREAAPAVNLVEKIFVDLIECVRRRRDAV